MKLRLFYNGKPEDTKIMNAETGEPIDGVISVALEVDAFGCNAIINLKDIEIDIDNAEAIAIQDESD
jgi:hypothetical protein